MTRPTQLRVCCWNVRRASRNSAAWGLFLEISPDLALLQEVNAFPKEIEEQYQIVIHQAAGKQPGQSQRFGTAIVARGKIGSKMAFSSPWTWVNRELEHFQGNLVAYRVTVLDREYKVMSVYSPAWPIDPQRLIGVDVETVKLKLNPKVWVTELLWAGLRSVSDPADPIPWIVGGDLNASETFDSWPGGPRGNRELLDRMQSLDLHECLRSWNGRLVPTFRNPSNKRIIHQMDHLFVSNSMATQLVSCNTLSTARVFEASLSDHLPIVADFDLPELVV